MKTTENLNKCPNCGGLIELDKVSGILHCSSCNSVFSYEQLTEKNEQSQYTVYEEYNEYICNDCGAVMVVDKNTITSCCAYCGNTSVMKNRISGKHHPDYIIPFEISINEAKKNFISVLRYKEFIKKRFRKGFTIQDITSIYVPFWLYDCDASGSCTYKTADGHMQNADFYEKYKKVPVDASIRIDDNYMDIIEPFDYSKLKPFDKAYLIGHVAERYDTDAKLMSKRAEGKINKSVKTSISRHIAEDKTSLTNNIFSTAVQGTQNYTNLFVDEIKAKMDTMTGGLTEHNINFENDREQMLDETCICDVKKMKIKIMMKRCQYALFPIYLLRGEYKGKNYLYAINGQNGKVAGKFLFSKLGKFSSELLGLAFGALLFSLIILLAIHRIISEIEVSKIKVFLILYIFSFLFISFMEIKTNGKKDTKKIEPMLGVKTTVANAKQYRVLRSFKIVKKVNKN